MRGIITLVIIVGLIGLGGAYGLYQSVKFPKPVEYTLEKLPKKDIPKWIKVSGGSMRIEKLVKELEDTPSPSLRRVLIPYGKDNMPATVMVEVSDQKRLDKLGEVLVPTTVKQTIDYAKVAEIVGIKDNVISGLIDSEFVKYNAESANIATLLKAKQITADAIVIREGSQPPGVAFSALVLLFAAGLLVGGIIFLKRTEGNAEEAEAALAGLTTDPSSAETRTAITDPAADKKEAKSDDESKE